MTAQQLNAMKLALEEIDKAIAKVKALCSGHERWIMSVPARPDDDPDLVIGGALWAAKNILKEALAEHAMQEVQRLGQEIEQKIGCVNHDCDQCKAQPEQEPVAWRNAAIRVGEDLSSVGPDGYYDMTAQQWLDWAMEQQPHGKNSLAQPEQEPVAYKSSIGHMFGDKR